MKKIILIALFAIYSISISAQVQGCSFVDTLAATQTKYFKCRSASEYAILTITLSNANDTVIVSVGSSLPDSAQTTQRYGQVSITDLLPASSNAVTVATGNTTTNRRYKIDTLKSKYIKLVSSSNGATINYSLEFY